MNNKQIPRLRIVFFHVIGQNFSGAAKSIFRLLKHINPEKLQPVLIGQSENELTQRLRELNIEVTIIPYPPALDIYDKKILNLKVSEYFSVIRDLWRYNILLLKTFRQIKPQVIWADNLRTFFSVYAASKLYRCKIILNIMSEPQGKIYWFLHRLGLILADVINLAYRQQGIKMFGFISVLKMFRKKLVTIYSGVTDFEKSTANDVREEFNLSSKDILLLMAANIVRGKGQMDLIKSFKLLSNKYPELNLLLAGRPSASHPDSLKYDLSLKKYVKDNKLTDRVRFLGWRSDMPDLLKATDIYVSTSYSESLPDVLRDAMYAGKPIVASNVGGTFELIKVGKNGLIFEPGDIECLVQHIEKLIKDPALRKAMGKEGKNIIYQRFSTKKYVRNFENMVLRLHLLY